MLANAPNFAIFGFDQMLGIQRYISISIGGSLTINEYSQKLDWRCLTHGTYMANVVLGELDAANISFYRASY